jgi:DNA-binding transcriptional LysR family regulator
MNISLRHLRAFAAISRAGSFTVAANQLHVSQSALSVLVKDLEDDLGVCLLDRTTRNVRVSEVGLTFLPQVQRILEDLEHAIHSIADLRDLKRGVARIAAPQLMSVTLIPSVLAVHRDRFPGVEARIVECLMEEVEAKVASGEADLGVGPERRVGPDVETLPLMKLPVMLVCPKRHPLATAGRVTWSDVVKQPFISQLGAYRALIDLDLHNWSKELALKPIHEVTYLTTALALVSSGLGVTASPLHVRKLAASFGLAMRPIVDPKMERRFCVFLPRGRDLSPAATSLLTCLKDVAREN